MGTKVSKEQKYWIPDTSETVRRDYPKPIKEKPQKLSRAHKYKKLSTLT